MNCSRLGIGAALVLLAVMAPAAMDAADEQQSDVASMVASGKVTYMARCASCHGKSGTGDGNVAEYLTIVPTDLTKIEVDDGGEFPFDAVYDIIDGRQVRGHGLREMPVWGPAFLSEEGGPSKQEVTQRISELVHYLKSIQK